MQSNEQLLNSSERQHKQLENVFVYYIVEDPVQQQSGAKFMTNPFDHDFI